MPLSGNDLFLQAASNPTVRVKNLNRIATFGNNKDFTFKVVTNKFVNMDMDTFRRTYTGHKKATQSPNQTYKATYGTPLPNELDLRLKGIVTPVKDQAVCGSCWTFGTAGTLEGRINYRNKLNGKPLVRVSEQQILSCTWDVEESNNLGCDGGDQQLAIQMIAKRMGGKVPLESKAPYLGMEGLCEESAWTDIYGIVNGSVLIDPT